MKLKIEIDMSNAAFESCNGAEASRILHKLADQIETAILGKAVNIRLMDENGNRVGQAVTR
jgi:hypothetical protein